ncbi:uncharacterized protein [Palaemon carinicauda]|uniref:uncharacterized protein n=1 Tax=Palaemon carinicauda TaxID=392227 RepID=UPI0035B69F61
MDSGVGTFHQPHWCFVHVHVYVVGPMPTSLGHRYLFTFIDRSIRLPEAIPMENVTSASGTLALLSGWIVRFGIPEHLSSNRGSSFTSQLWTSLANLLGITLDQTTACNPTANSRVERFQRTLKAALMSCCKDSNCLIQVPYVLLGLKPIPKDILDVSAAEIW